MNVFESMPPPEKCDDRGLAWQIDLAGLAKKGVAPNLGCLAMWVIEARWAHPIWHSYMLSLCHLRPIEGMPPAIIHVPSAGYEMVLFALNPEARRDEMLRTGKVVQHRLEPANFMAQFWDANDEAAIARIAETVDRILAGKLNPDTDGMGGWINLFGNAGIKPEWR